jgi:hypothetical protein
MPDALRRICCTRIADDKAFYAPAARIEIIQLEAAKGQAERPDKSRQEAARQQAEEAARRQAAAREAARQQQKEQQQQQQQQQQQEQQQGASGTPSPWANNLSSMLWPLVAIVAILALFHCAAGDLKRTQRHDRLESDLEGQWPGGDHQGPRACTKETRCSLVRPGDSLLLVRGQAWAKGIIGS